MRWNGKTKAMVGGGVILVVALAATLLLRRPHDSVTIGGNPLRPREYGAETPEAVVTEVFAACQAHDYRRVADLFVDGKSTSDTTVMKNWCRVATSEGRMQVWEYDETRTRTDSMGMTLVTKTWLDAAKTQPAKTVQWWLTKEENRWVMTGGL